MDDDPPTRQEFEAIKSDLSNAAQHIDAIKAVMRQLTLKLGYDWKELIDKAERREWAEREREKLRRG